MSGDESDSPVDNDSRTVIGIAFGNTSSSIAYTTPDGKVDVIANEEGDRQIPTVLSYKESEEFHGTQAKSQLVRNAENTVAYFRDFLGKKYSEIDPTNCHNSAHPVDVDGTVSFKIKESEEGEPTAVSVSEITTRHLKRLRSSAADFLGKNVNATVIAVPTDFTEPQKEAIVAASKAADLEVLQIIHEPVAAVLAYAAKDDVLPSDKTVLVLDLGGTRCDAAVVAVRGGMYTILGTAHDYELGGVKLDSLLVEHFAKEFQKKHKVDPRENARGLAKLKLEAEAVKRTLSLGTTATLAIESLAEGHDFHSTINRLRYELLSKGAFDQMVKLAESAIAKAELDVLDIDEVILSGGSSHTPKIATRLAALFPESTPIHAPATETTAINPSELAARGAAIQASLVAEFDQEDIEQSIHPAVTVAPHLSKAIGVVVSGAAGQEEFQTLLPAQTAIPARRIAEFLAPDAGGDVVVKIVEGAREIETHKPEKKQPNGDEKKDEDDDLSDFSDSEDEEEEIRTKVLKVEKLLAEARLKDVKKGQKVEVTVNVGHDLSLAIAARIVGTQTGVRGTVKAPE